MFHGVREVKALGNSIMRFMAKLALEHECRSLSWNAEKSNAGANRFINL